VLSQHDTPEMVRQAFRAGARGYVIKSSVGQNLWDAVQKVSRHESFIDPAISEVSPPRLISAFIPKRTTLLSACNLTSETSLPSLALNNQALANFA